LKLNQAMKRKIFGRIFLFGLFLAGNTVVADDVKLANGQHASATLGRRGALKTSPPASATEAASAATGTMIPAASATPEGANAKALPPLPSGVTELQFNEFFRQPIGPRGLEFTDQLRSLDGRRIRILGYMVRQARPVDRCFLLASRPITVNEAEYGLCDDLPSNTVHVITGADAPAQTPFTPGPLLLTGTLSVGNRVEADGRVSAVRLHLDAPTTEQRRAAVAAAEAMARQPDPHAGHHH
jgi:hypothetical protein